MLVLTYSVQPLSHAFSGDLITGAAWHSFCYYNHSVSQSSVSNGIKGPGGAGIKPAAVCSAQLISWVVALGLHGKVLVVGVAARLL